MNRAQARAAISNRFLCFLRDRRGVSSIEYALLLFAILLLAAGAYRLLGKSGQAAANKAQATLMGQDPGSNPGNGGAGPGSGGAGGAGSGGEFVCDGHSCNAPGQCFVAGTLVATPAGERPIEDLKVGELVLSRGDADGALEARPITHTFERLAPSLVDVHVLTIDGARERVRSTPEHLYFTRDRGWLGAGDLLAGEALTDREGREVQVTAVVPVPQEAVVYNLEVDADHTYFVGQSAVWVHNLPCTGAPGQPAPPSAAPPTVVTGPVMGTGGGAGPGSAVNTLTSSAESDFQTSVGTVPGSDFADYMHKAEQAKFNNPALYGSIPTYQLAGVIGYTGPDYSALNSALRAGKPGTYQAYIDAANQGLDKLPDYTGAVYRGTTLDPKYLAPYQVGQVVQEAAFTSTSHDPSVATAFQGGAPPPGKVNVTYIIQSKHGKEVENISYYGGEAEVLFKSGTKFKVLNRTDGAGSTTIYLEEV